MPEPGDPYANAFVSEPMQCWRMIHDRQGQAAHCHETPSWTERWFSPSGDRWWIVWACPDHLEGAHGGSGSLAGVSLNCRKRAPPNGTPWAPVRG
jgi:hypothetical protein